jgi:hypothetical protein
MFEGLFRPMHLLVMDLPDPEKVILSVPPDYPS